MSSNDFFNTIVTAEMAADARGDFFLEFAATTQSTQFFGDQFGAAVAYLAAFLLNSAPATAAQSTGAVGPLISRTTGKESISWGQLQMLPQAAQDAIFLADPYGAIYVWIRNTRKCAGPLVAQTAQRWPSQGWGWGLGSGGGVW